MKNRKLLLIVSIVLALTMSLGGTLAYLTDTDADVNVMVLGNVTIVQNEERFVDGKLVEYKDQPALPAVGDTATPVNKEIRGEQYGFVGAANVNDKIVTVTNMGNTDAWVRTIIAVEAPEGFNFELAHLNLNEEGITWTNWKEVFVGEGNDRYMYAIATYNAKLAAKATSVPSLLQVYLDKATNNGDIAMLDGEWEIIALSQAVQADGFGTADEAFAAAFEGDVGSWLADAEKHIGSPNTDPETGKNDTNLPPMFTETVENADELTAALEAGRHVVLTEDVTVDTLTVSKDGDMDLGENKVTGDPDNAAMMIVGAEKTISNGTVQSGTSDARSAGYTFGISNGADVTFDDVDVIGGGINVQYSNVTFNSGSINITSTNTSQRHIFYAAGEGSVVTINGGEFSFEAYRQRTYAYADVGAKIFINGGTFGVAPNHPRWTDPIVAANGGEVIITGGTFGFDPTAWVADGYEAMQNGSTWTVQAK